jgi:TatA/E family protein of Tat protein translocase
MGAFSPVHILIIAIFIVIVFGANKVPELMRGIGKGMGELQKGIDESKRMMTQAMNEVHEEPKVETQPYVAPIPDPPKVDEPQQVAANVETPVAEVAKPKTPRKPKVTKSA